MAGNELRLQQFSDVLKNIDPGLGPAASQLWEGGVNTEPLLRTLTKQDMQRAGLSQGNSALIYNHFHPTDAGERDLGDWIYTFNLVLNRSPMSSSAAAADKTRTQTPSFVRRWPDIPDTIMQDAEQKVAQQSVMLSLLADFLDFRHKVELREILAANLWIPLSTAPTAQLGWPEITFGGPQDTTNDQVMYLRSDNTAIAMGQIETAAERPSDNLLDSASPSNFLQTYLADTQPGAGTTGSGSKQLPKYVTSKSCQQIRALYTAMQESQVPYGYMITNEQLWLVYVELQEGCMYLSDGISMRFRPGHPTVPRALLWLASQHTLQPQQLHHSEAPPPCGPDPQPKASTKQPVWRHVAQPDALKTDMDYATPEATLTSYPALEFEPHSKPIGRGASGTVWQGLVDSQRAAVKVSHPDSPDSVTELRTEGQFYSEHPELQGRCIPRLLWKGWVQFDDEETPAYWLATSMEGPALSRLQPLTDAVMEAAQQALAEYHAGGAEHNDVRWDNIVLQADAERNSGKSRCLLVDHGRATWGYKVESPSWETREFERLIQQQQEWRSSRRAVTRSCMRARLFTTRSQLPRTSGHWVG